jgi:Flp pilus assembly protein TadD
MKPVVASLLGTSLLGTSVLGTSSLVASSRRRGGCAFLAAALLAGGCSLPEVRLLGPSMPAFVQTDDVEAPRPTGGREARSRRLFLALVGGLRDQGKTGAALAFLDDYDRAYPDDPQARLLRADCLLALGRAADAAPVYRALLGGPQAAAAQSGLGRVLAAAGQWAQAREAFAAAVALAPSNAHYLNNLGYAAWQAGDRAAAEFALRKAAELDPRNPVTRNNLALCASGAPPRTASAGQPEAAAAPAGPTVRAEN